MAPAFDAVLGVNTNGNASATTTSLVTGAAAAIGSRIVVGASHFGTPTFATNAMAGGGLTWVRDFLLDDADNTTLAVFSADCPAGLASGTTLTVTHSASIGGRSLWVASFTGLAGGASGYLNGTPAGTAAAFSGTSWATPSITTTGEALLVSFALGDGAPADPWGTVTSPALEIIDDQDPTSTTGDLVGYRILASGGSNTVAGTFASAPAEWRASVVGYASGGPTIPAVAVDYTLHPNPKLARKAARIPV